MREHFTQQRIETLRTAEEIKKKWQKLLISISTYQSIPKNYTMAVFLKSTYVIFTALVHYILHSNVYLKILPKTSSKFFTIKLRVILTGER